MRMARTHTQPAATTTPDQPPTSAPMPPVELATASQLAHMLGVKNCRTVLRAYNAGLLPHPIKIGGEGHQRWRTREIRDWIIAGCPEGRFWQWKPTYLPKLEDVIRERHSELHTLTLHVQEARNELADLDRRIAAGRMAIDDLNRQVAQIASRHR